MQHSEFFNDMNRQVENLISGHRMNDETGVYQWAED